MSIGIIIFVISVIVTIIGAISDNSHKERQNQNHQSTNGQMTMEENHRNVAF